MKLKINYSYEIKKYQSFCFQPLIIFAYYIDFEEVGFTDWIETLRKLASNNIDWAFSFLLVLMS